MRLAPDEGLRFSMGISSRGDSQHLTPARLVKDPGSTRSMHLIKQEQICALQRTLRGHESEH